MAATPEQPASLHNLVPELFLLVLGILLPLAAAADPQTFLLNEGCSQYNASNLPNFFANLNTTFASLRSNISSSSSSSGFATAKSLRGSDPVYAIFQCRDYLSPSNCLACFDTAAKQLRANCTANGARIIFDGCFLRYESNDFSASPATLPGHEGKCYDASTATKAPSSSSPPSTAAAAAIDTLLTNLYTAVPKIPGFFAASSSGGVFGVAQCVRTATVTGCSDCLKVAYDGIKGCPPAPDARAVDAGCFMRYSTRSFFPANKTTDLVPLLVSGSGTTNSGRKKTIVIAVVGSVCVLLLVGLLAFFVIYRRSSSTRRRGDLLGATELQGPKSFRYRDLKAATRNFSEENKLGEGGFGDVYKGVLKNGKVVAVKKLAIGESTRVKLDFQSEVKLISNVHHRNLIRLLGCSSKGPNLLLVYEYMPNNSLDKLLFGERQGTLNWKQRFNIILGMARGLAYLHEEFHVCIIHRDIKSSNILLDDEFQPKIADFGLARLLPEDRTHLTTRFAGTLGYTAPEYAIHGQLSEKVDTYSYGVVVLEIISGRKSNDINLQPVTQYLLEWAWKLYEDELLLELVDEALYKEEHDADELIKIIEIALLCTQSIVSARPAMSEVVMMLLSKSRPQIRPTRPIFIDATRRTQDDTDTTYSVTTSKGSHATVSVTQLSAR